MNNFVDLLDLTKGALEFDKVRSDKRYTQVSLNYESFHYK